ncbi:MAG: carboxypeptidase-like regulatory domain-containing protein, partial [Tannerella sp.]|nr:carboxypeptidase-like regulatory domain-containing protein [Tannerella sp.]
MRHRIYSGLFACLLFSLMAAYVQAGDDGEALARKIQLSKSKGTVYQLLREVSGQSGYLFIYDSQLIRNDRVVKIRKGEYSLAEAIRMITGNERLKIEVLGKHILLRVSDGREPVRPAAEETKPAERKERLAVEGILYDQTTREPLVYASVGIVNSSIGTVSNQNGEFRLLIPDSLYRSKIRFSHIGYEGQETEIPPLCGGQQMHFLLEPKIFQLQEIVVKVVNPVQLLNEMLAQREKNYSPAPVHLTAFYREGIDHKQRNIDLTEAVLQVYKTGYPHPPDDDQAKLIRKRRISGHQESDTIFPKMKSGIRSCFILDVVKELPDFLNPGVESLYKYAHTDISMMDDRRVDEISFVQKQEIREPLYTGKLFIEAESKALVEAQFEVNPEYVNKATNLFIDKKTPSLRLSLQQAKYIVSYKRSDNGTYHINHVRGDIRFKVKRKTHLFSTPVHFWFEMVTCKTDTVNVKSIPRSERLSLHTVFAETKHLYDRYFWEHFNIILPEEKLKEVII